MTTTRKVTIGYAPDDRTRQGTVEEHDAASAKEIVREGRGRYADTAEEDASNPNAKPIVHPDDTEPVPPHAPPTATGNEAAEPPKPTGTDTKDPEPTGTERPAPKATAKATGSKAGTTASGTPTD